MTAERDEMVKTDSRRSAVGQRRVGLVTVARAVGVSPSTVSNAYNRPDQLSAGLRTRILETAAELGYAGPDPVARSLRSGRAGAIGVTFATELNYPFTDPAAAEFVGGIAEVVGAHDLALVLVQGAGARPSNTPPVRRAAVDGFIAHGLSHDNPLLEATLRRGLPTVLVDAHAVPEHDFVGIEDGQAAATAMTHLLELGHRRLAILDFGPPTELERRPDSAEAGSADPVALRRLEACQRTVRSCGLDWSSVAVQHCSGSTTALGRTATHALLDADPSVTAIFAFSDVLAAGALQAARERGRSVPDELSVVGFDDTAAPSLDLTSVHQPLRKKGWTAAERLMGRLESAAEEPPRHVLLPTHLVVRGSTAAVAA